MIQAIRRVLQKGREVRSRANESEIIPFASGLFRQLPKIDLSPIVKPVTMSEVPAAGCKDGRDDNAGTLTIMDRRHEVRILRIAVSVIGIGPTGDHDNFVTIVVWRPALHKVAERK